jgi:undecaprenyl-diphosphatase
VHLHFRESDPAFVPVLTMLHLGTAAALIILYREQWWRIVVGLVRVAVSGRVVSPDERLAVLLLLATIPAGLVGFFFQSPLTALFADPRAASVFLVVNAVVLLSAEWFRRRDERRRGVESGQPVTHRPGDPAYAPVERLGLRAAMIVGFCQVAALFPGISRSGITMAAGLFAGLRHDEAARFSFLLATPIILAAGLLEVPALGPERPTAALAAAAAVLAGLVAYLSARFLLRYLRAGRLDPFAYYCAVLGAVGLVLLH